MKLFLENNRAFKGVWIPKEIWCNKELNITERCFLTEIDSIDNDEGCFAYYLFPYDNAVIEY